MLNKKLVISSAILALSLALPVFAQTPKAASDAVSGAISCVSVAVTARENALFVALGTHVQSVQNAYGVRGTSLAQAYTHVPDVGLVRSDIKAAWSTFRASIKSATKTWQGARNTAWSQFKTAARACKAPASVTDTSNSSSEVSGQ